MREKQNRQRLISIVVLLHIKKIQHYFVKDEVSVYAAQASFFLVLSVFPFLMLLLSAIRLIPGISQNDLLLTLSHITPEKIHPLLEYLIYDLYTAAPATILSVTTITAVWSASRGMLGIERGLNRIAGCTSRRGYLISRLVNSCYTIIFILVCIASLILLVFGSALQQLLLLILPVSESLSPWFLSLRSLLALTILILFFMALYTWLPYRQQNLKQQLPGALLSTVGWIGCSFGFSVYFSRFKGFSHMYGRLAAVAILMLWLYVCICVLFIGAEINRHWGKIRKANPSSPPKETCIKQQ